MPGKHQPEALAAGHIAGCSSTAEQLETALARLPSDVSGVVRAWLEHPRQAARGRSALHGCEIARARGYEAVGFAARGLIHVEGPEGAAVLAPLAFETLAHEAGLLNDQRRLRRALEGVVGDERYVLHIRRPLPANFDPEPVIQAVALWQHARRRGEYQGRDAIYEDDGVHIELALTDVPRGEAEAALLVQANPIPGLERMSVVGSILLRLSALHERIHHLGPLIPVLTAEPAWRLTRGHAEQVLYGTARSVSAVGGGAPSYSAVHEKPEGLLGDPACKHLAAVWWLESCTDGVMGWSHENPWCMDRERAPKYPGRRYEVAEALELDRFRLRWTA
ncbi:MAG: hypothetical protein KC912_05045 [Proteobacteria bacterium]|nr:hypothetical protein [Pseudomonadota bacterium]